MINDIKLGFQLMKHGLQLKMSIFWAVLFAILGFLLEGSNEFNMFVGSMYTMMGGLMIYQLVHSVAYSGIVQSSPMKKRMQTSIPVACTFVYAMILNTISILVKLVIAHQNHMSMQEVATRIFISSIPIVVLLAYIGGAMKAFWASSVFFMIACFFAGFVGFFVVKRGILMNLNFSLGTAIIMSYLAVVAGCAVMYLISIVLYKKDYSKITFESSLKRAK